MHAQMSRLHQQDLAAAARRERIAKVDVARRPRLSLHMPQIRLARRRVSVRPA
jgi:hypothetical protein